MTKKEEKGMCPVCDAPYVKFAPQKNVSGALRAFLFITHPFTHEMECPNGHKFTIRADLGEETIQPIHRPVPRTDPTSLDGWLMEVDEE